MSAEPRISLQINGKRFDHWTSVEVERHVNCYSTVKFETPFEPNRKEFRQNIKPFSFAPVQVFVGDGLLFTGTMMDVNPAADASSSAVSVTCYARPAILDDCEPPNSAYDDGGMEFDGMDIVEIASKICGALGFKADIASDGSVQDVQFSKKKIRIGRRGGRGAKGSKFARMSLQPGDKPQSFLAGLAKQRDLMLTDDEDGDLLLLQPVAAGHPVAKLVFDGLPPVIAVTPQFNPQDFFSEITAWTPTVRGRKGTKYTQKNPLLDGVIRPSSFKPDDTDRGNAQETARSHMGRMFGNMVGWEVELPTMLDPNGNLYVPNTTILLTAPKAMIYLETELLIRTVTLRQDPNASTCTLGVVLPGSFSGKFPEFFPWEEPEIAALQKTR